MNHDKSLQNIIFDMLTKGGSFYGLFLAELNVRFDKAMKTACVGKHKDSPTLSLILGEDFWEKTCTSNEMKKNVLIHELEHIIREHLSDAAQSMFPQKLMGNIAQDIAINQDIPGEMPRITHEGVKCGVSIDDYKNTKMKRNESSLYYYNFLLKAKEEKKESEGKGEDSKNPNMKKGNGKGTTGDSALDELLDWEASGQMPDWHDKWKELTDGMGDKEKELFRKEIQEAVKRVADETIKSRGTVPSHISHAINQNFGNKEPVISWKTLFNRFIGSSLSTDIKQSRKRPNFRFEDAAVNKFKHKIKIVVGVDTSGSVSEEDLKEFFGQIHHMWKAGVQVDICLWDAECEDAYKYAGDRKYKRTKSGGTVASCFTQYVNKQNAKNNWTCAVGLTDGYVESEVTDTKIPLMWVIAKGGSMSFKSKGKKVMIN